MLSFEISRYTFEDDNSVVFQNRMRQTNQFLAVQQANRATPPVSPLDILCLSLERTVGCVGPVPDALLAKIKTVVPTGIAVGFDSETIRPRSHPSFSASGP